MQPLGCPIVGRKRLVAESAAEVGQIGTCSQHGARPQDLRELARRGGAGCCVQVAGIDRQDAGPGNRPLHQRQLDLDGMVAQLGLG